MISSLGFDQYYRRPLPSIYQSVSAVNYDALFEDASITGVKILDSEIDSSKIKSVKADKIETSTLTTVVNIGKGEGYVKLDGPNNRIIVNDGVNDRILIGLDEGGF